MAETISSKPGIECFPENIKLCETLFYDTAQRKLEKIRKLTDEELLWTGESAYYICTHHVEQHCTVRNGYGRGITIHCHGSEERCNCELFRTYSIRIDLIGDNFCHKIVTEGLDIV